MTAHPTILAEAERRAKLAGIPAALVVPFIEADVAKSPYKLTYEDLGWGPLMRVQVIGDQYNLKVNIAHPWVQRMMWGKDVTADMRSKIEVVLFTLSGIDYRAGAERERYDAEMYQWGVRLWHATDCLLEPGRDGLNLLGEDPLADDDEEEG